MFSGKKAREMELSILQEAFRALKSNILFCGKENKIKTITITSCSPGEGKTAIALNLAISLARSDIKVLLVDAEFRKGGNPCLSDNGMERETAKHDFPTALPAGLIKETGINNLSYLSIGSSFSNPERLIDSPQLKSFISDLSEGFDMVIADVPPLEGIIDGVLIAAATDATILVIQSMLHDYSTVLQAKEKLERANIRILGTVLRKVDNSSFKSYFKYLKYCRTKDPKISLELNNSDIFIENKLAMLNEVR